ncbi:MAG: RNA polymerase subunit sigma-70 [Phycisphaeraceae bacterium]|nr:hypothetical protein [Phycisphaerales bacterium]MCB9861196.1 RNA polymerase subunit sigma-70 [Phycisphaeraceae bacterium]
MQDPNCHVTELLNNADARSGAELLDEVYAQLKHIARARMKRERADHTLQATALVHEAYMDLIGNQALSWESRAHFYYAAALAMRRILIDHARGKNAQKRGGGQRKLPLGLIDLAEHRDPAEILALEDAMRVLESEDPRASRVVSLRLFAGLSVEDTAKSLDVSERTVIREWTFARARLFELLSDENTQL